MDAVAPSTYLQPPERADDATIQRQAALLADSPTVDRLLDALPDLVFFFNKQRQIVRLNRAAYEFIALIHGDCRLGLRLGEALRCVRAREPPAGCGTTVFCRACGAARGVGQALSGVYAVQECRVLRDVDESALDLRVWVEPFDHRDEHFVLAVVSEVSDEKRRRVLEKIFFHDLLNTALGLRGVSERLDIVPAEDHDRLHRVMRQLTDRLIDEIVAQRQLSAAESGDLVTRRTEVSALETLRALAEEYTHHPSGRRRVLRIAGDAVDATLQTDAALLGRVLGNLLKNALEAVGPDGIVTVTCGPHEGGVRFAVHNPTYMEPEVQLQIFHRFFSTKGAGRGLGTHGARLFAERYLGGHVLFESQRSTGTTFRVWLPLR